MNTITTAEADQLDIDKAVLNVSAYKFVTLDQLENRRETLKRLADECHLLGTILLSSEGINMFLAGSPEGIDRFFFQLRKSPEFSDITPKASFSDRRPFRRMLVRLKKEIIAFGVDSVNPIEKTSEKISAKELKQWLDEGRPLRLLDTRNTYEVELGTFRGAEHLGLSHFREFPAAIGSIPEEAREQPIVMFCTGGIRCEKAGPMMEQAGFKKVYQLDGGILKYFEEVGGEHYDGSCFVFDSRVALDPQLNPTGDGLCFICQAVLSPADMQSSQYEIGKSCPRCYVSPDVVRKKNLVLRQAAVRAAAEEQLGCTPYTNVRKIYVAGKFAGFALIDFLSNYHLGIERGQWVQWITDGDIQADGQNVTTDYVVREGECFTQKMPLTVEPPVNPNIELVHEDDFIIVVNKPAPMPTHPSGRYNKNSLTEIVGRAYGNSKIRAMHRLDANTSGVVILSRKHQASRLIQPQFAGGEVDKRYVARVYGHCEADVFSSNAPISPKPNEFGAREIASNGQAARTCFRVLQRFPDSTTLLEVIPKTGRTNQIRVHLWGLGYPIVGDSHYLPGRSFGKVATLDLAADPMCLHASEISFRHPESNQFATYSAPLPAWATLESLHGSAS